MPKAITEGTPTLDVKNGKYFADRGFTDQHAGGRAFAKDSRIMGWLFGKH